MASWYGYSTCNGAGSGTWSGYAGTAGTTTTYYGTTDSDGTTVTDSNGYYWIQPTTYMHIDWEVPPETPEQSRERQRRERTYARQQKELQKEQAAAVKKAEEILKEYIGIERFGELHKVGYIEVDSHKPGVKYRIHKDQYEMIDVMDKNNKVVDRLCIHTAVGCPGPDEILAKVILAELDEELLNSKANHHRINN